MTTRYVDGANGNDAWDGSSPTFVSGTTGPKKTIAGAEALVAAGDLVHVKAGTYRESVTLGASGTAGNAIELRGDYSGLIWPGSGGVVRWTGSDNDQTAARASCIVATTRHFRTFTNFSFDTTSGSGISATSACHDWIVQKCHFQGIASNAISFSGLGINNVVQNCVFIGVARISILNFTNTVTGSIAGSVVQNCIFAGGSNTIIVTRVDGLAIKNCAFIGPISNGVDIGTALALGQSISVNNCIFTGCATAMVATALGEIVEDYNDFYLNTTDRTNVATGVNSKTLPPLLDTRWFFQMVAGGKMATPYDLASYSQLINVAGTSPSSTDLRGTAVQGAQREWGALEYDPALTIAGGAGGKTLIIRR